MEERSVQIAARISPKGMKIIEALKDRLGLNTTSVIELSIRRMGQLEGVVDDHGEVIGPAEKEGA